MEGKFSHELEADLSADDVWAVYGTMQLPELVAKLLPNIAANIKVEQGDGGVGTILYVTYPSGGPGPQFQREKFVTVDHKQRVKEVILIEGGYLALGFITCLFRFEIIEKGSSTSVIRSTLEYEISDEVVPDAASFVTSTPLAAIAGAIVEYLTEKKAKKQRHN